MEQPAAHIETFCSIPGLAGWLAGWPAGWIFPHPPKVERIRELCAGVLLRRKEHTSGDLRILAFSNTGLWGDLSFQIPSNKLKSLQIETQISSNLPTWKFDSSQILSNSLKSPQIFWICFLRRFEEIAEEWSSEKIWGNSSFDLRRFVEIWVYLRRFEFKVIAQKSFKTPTEIPSECIPPLGRMDFWWFFGDLVS